MLEANSIEHRFKDWQTLMTAAAELERAYIKLGVIRDDRIKLHGWPHLTKEDILRQARKGTMR